MAMRETGTCSLAEERTIIRIGRRVSSIRAAEFTPTEERAMFDPKEEKKGGFGAFAQRDRERREAEALKTATPNGATPAAPSTPPSSDSTARSDATPGSPAKP
jgi:hypothetical protein